MKISVHWGCQSRLCEDDFCTGLEFVDFEYVEGEIEGTQQAKIL